MVNEIMYKFWQKQVLNITCIILIATFFCLWLFYKIGILNDQNVIIQFMEKQGCLWEFHLFLIQIVQVVFRHSWWVTTVVGCSCL